MTQRLEQDRLRPQAEGGRWKLEFSLFTSPSFNFYHPRHLALQLLLHAPLNQERHFLPRRLDDACPNGAAASSPRLAPRAYLGFPAPTQHNPNGVVPRPSGSPGHNPVGLRILYAAVSQGSSCLATLGFTTQPRWG